MSSAVVSYQPTSFGELEVFCKRITSTQMVPPAYKGKPDEAAVAIIFGNEIGLPPMTALQMVAVINGRPGVFGDALPGLAMNKGLIRDMREHFEGEPFRDDFVAVCEVVRPNGTPVIQRFSVADAKRAGLWDKAGPWKQYPKRMLQWRARGWAIRDAAPNLLFGMTAEELQDIETAEMPRGPDTARDITPEQPAPGPRAAAEAAMEAIMTVEPLPIEEDPADPLRIAHLSGKEAFQALEWALEGADAATADSLLETYRHRVEKLPEALRKAIGEIVVAKITGKDDEQGALV
jgi:hypothetical protein